MIETLDDLHIIVHNNKLLVFDGLLGSLCKGVLLKGESLMCGLGFSVNSPDCIVMFIKWYYLVFFNLFVAVTIV
jgi:hypothetical protein